MNKNTKKENRLFAESAYVSESTQKSPTEVGLSKKSNKQEVKTYSKTNAEKLALALKENLSRRKASKENNED